jgi:predicted phosphodiesterase
MKVIKSYLPTTLETVELHIFADEHIGDDNSDIERLKERIDYVARTPNAYCILNGDIIDYTSRTSIGDIEAREFNIMGQLEKAAEIFAPIKDKIIAITSGNHEGRGYRKEGFDIAKILAYQLGIGEIYSPAAALIFLRFGKGKSHGRGGREPRLYTIYVNHGSGGGRKEGAKAIRLADMANVVDADIYIHSHTHLPMIMKEGYFRTDLRNSTVQNVTKLFVNTSSNLDYGGYGEAQEFKPNSKDTPVIYLSAKHKEARAVL